MAFSNEEQQIIQWAKDNGKTGAETRDAIFRFRATGSPQEKGVEPVKSPLRKAGEVAVGVGKGLVETTVETAALLQKGGQAAIAAVDPTRTFQEVKAETGVPSLQGEQLEGIRETLRAKTPEEKAGKIVAFGAELLLPVAKTKIPSLVRKGVEKVKDVAGIKVSSARTELDSLISKGVIKAEDALNPIDAGVETVLRRTNKETFNKYVSTAEKARVEPKAPTGLEIAGNRAEDALDIMQRKLKEFGRQKSTILNQAAVGNKQVGNIAVKFRQSLNQLADSKTLDSGDQKLINDILAEAKKLGDNPRAKEVDQFVDFVQEKIFTSGRSLTIDVTDATVASLRQSTRALNESLKDQLPDAYRQANLNFSELIGLRNELNQKLGKEGERAASLMKRIFSPSDNRTKEMFQEVLDVTNVDLVDEAVLARYTMDVFGDARQRSLLQSVLEIRPVGLTRQVVEGLVDRLLGRFKGTEAELRKALRIIEEAI